jgi:UDP-glucose 4-epimerase
MRRPMLVVGGAGFVGHHLVPRLLEADHDVVVIDNLSRGSLERFGPHLGDARLAIVRGDVTDAVLVRQVLAEVRPAVVFHLAALHFIPYCTAHPSETLLVNVVGTQLVLDALAAVPDARLFNVYGPGETNPHVLPDVCAQVREGNAVRLGNLEPRRDYVHVRDVADALLRLAGYDGPETVFNVGTGVGVSVAELVETLAGVLGRKLRIERDPTRVRPVERPHLVADVTRVQRTLGWTARLGLRDGLRDLVAHELAEVA